MKKKLMIWPLTFLVLAGCSSSPYSWERKESKHPVLYKEQIKDWQQRERSTQDQ